MLAVWAICPSDVQISNCFMARKGLNGTLVLTAHNQEGYEIVAYLTFTDPQSCNVPPVLFIITISTLIEKHRKSRSKSLEF